MRNFIIPLVSIFLLQPKLYSQINKDSLWEVFQDRGLPDTVRLKAIDIIAWDGFLYSNPDSSFYYAQLQYDLAKSKKLKKQMALAVNTQGVALDIKGDYEKALIYYFKSLIIRESLNDKQGIASSLNNIATVYRNQGNYKDAIDFFIKSYKIKDEIGDKKGAANSLLGIGNILKEQGELTQAIEYFEKSLQVREEIGDKKGVANSIMAIGGVKHILKEYDLAVELFEKANVIQTEIGDRYGISNSLNNLAVTYQEKGMLTKALEYYFESLKIREEVGDKLGITSSMSNIGVLYQKQGKYNEAIRFGQKSLQIAREMGALKQLKDSYVALYNTYKLCGQYQNALEMHEQFILIRDSILSEENHKEVTKLQLQYKYEIKATSDSIKNIELQKLKDAQIAAQIAENDKQKAEIKVKRNQQYALFGGLGLVIVFSLFIYNRFRLTSKQKNIIEKQKEEVEIQRQLADTQRKLVEEKNKEITDSINYAKRIQEAILPSKDTLTQHLGDGFVLFKPKDMVSGDFYWLESYTPTSVENSDLEGIKHSHNVPTKDSEESIILFAAADCTGHGVPGAMMSVICSNALSKALLEEKITDTGMLLDRTRELVIERLAKSSDQVYDGMDISLCSFKGNTLCWSGANNPLWIIADENRADLSEFNNLTDLGGKALYEIKPNKQPIGKVDNPEPFATYTFELQKDDTIYLFTDGYQDQFGGVKGKKFKASKLKELLLAIKGKSMEEQKKILEHTLDNWKGGIEQVDDVCVIGVRL
ncbi:MAG: tetratricopeptide repeat protein [Flavobacteriales bacterium]